MSTKKFGLFSCCSSNSESKKAKIEEMRKARASKESSMNKDKAYSNSEIKSKHSNVENSQEKNTNNSVNNIVDNNNNKKENENKVNNQNKNNEDNLSRNASKANLPPKYNQAKLSEMNDDGEIIKKQKSKVNNLPPTHNNNNNLNNSISRKTSSQLHLDTSSNNQDVRILDKKRRKEGDDSIKMPDSDKKLISSYSNNNSSNKSKEVKLIPSTFNTDSKLVEEKNKNNDKLKDNKEKFKDKESKFLSCRNNEVSNDISYATPESKRWKTQRENSVLNEYTNENDLSIKGIHLDFKDMKSPLKEDTNEEAVVKKDINTKLNENKEDIKTSDNHHKSNSTINKNNQNISKNELQEKNPSLSANKAKIKISVPVSSSNSKPVKGIDLENCAPVVLKSSDKANAVTHRSENFTINDIKFESNKDYKNELDGMKSYRVNLIQYNSNSNAKLNDIITNSNTNSNMLNVQQAIKSKIDNSKDISDINHENINNNDKNNYDKNKVIDNTINVSNIQNTSSISNINNMSMNNNTNNNRNNNYSNININASREGIRTNDILVSYFPELDNDLKSIKNNSNQLNSNRETNKDVKSETNRTVKFISAKQSNAAFNFNECSPKKNNDNENKSLKENNSLYNNRKNSRSDKIIDTEITNNDIDEYNYDPVNDERASTYHRNDLNESMVSSNILTHVYTPKMIQNIKNENQSFYSSFNESMSRIDTQNNILTQSFNYDNSNYSNYNGNFANTGGSNFEREMDMQNPNMPKFNIETPKSSSHVLYSSFKNPTISNTPYNPNSSMKSMNNNSELHVNNMMNRTSKNPFQKNPLQVQRSINDLSENIKVKDKDIKNMKAKISKLINEIQNVEDSISKHGNLIDKEEAEAERLRHYLNYLMTSQV